MSNFTVGTKVFLRGCQYGAPGTVIRQERTRAVVYWHDLDHTSRHRPDSLIEAVDATKPLSEEQQG